MEALKVKLLHNKATVPTRGTENSAGYDLYCVEDFQIAPKDRTLAATGIAMKLPKGVYGRVAPRSGLTVKNGIHIGAGVIDPDYTGEVKVAMFNLGETTVSFERGDRIAQLILEKFEAPPVECIDTLSVTDRGEGGFGSTGN